MKSEYLKKFKLSTSRKILRRFYCNYSEKLLNARQERYRIAKSFDFKASTGVDQVEQNLINDLIENQLSAKNVLEAKIHFYLLVENFPLTPLLMNLLNFYQHKFDNFPPFFLNYHKRIFAEKVPIMGSLIPDESDFVYVDNGFKHNLVIAFSGRARKALGLAWNTFNDYYVRNAHANLLVLKDNYDVHYRLGIESLGRGSLHESLIRLNKFIFDRKFEKVVLVGSSAGTLAALMYSLYIDCNAVICLSGKIEFSDFADHNLQNAFDSQAMLNNSFVHKELSVKSSLCDCNYYYACGRFSGKDFNASVKLKELIRGLETIYYQTNDHAFLHHDLQDSRIRNLIKYSFG